MPVKGRSGFRILVAAAAVFVPLAGMAQPAPPAPTSPAPPQPTSPAPSPPSAEAAADGRIRVLQTQLHITDAQMPQWNAFAQAMRQNAVSTDTLFRDRAKNAATMSALDNMKSYAQIARAYADNTEALERAFESLYTALTDEQKRTIDTLFREQAAKNAGAPTTHP